MYSGLSIRFDARGDRSSSVLGEVRSSGSYTIIVLMRVLSASHWILVVLVAAVPAIAGAQNITTINNWKASEKAVDPFTGGDADVLSTVLTKPAGEGLTTSAPVKGYFDLRVSLKSQCNAANGDYAFQISLEHAAWDADKQAQAASGVTGKSVRYRWKYDDDGAHTSNYSANSDTPENFFEATFPAADLNRKNYVRVGAESLGRLVILQIDLRDPSLTPALEACESAKTGKKPLRPEVKKPAVVVDDHKIKAASPPPAPKSTPVVVTAPPATPRLASEVVAAAPPVAKPAPVAVSPAPYSPADAFADNFGRGPIPIESQIVAEKNGPCGLAWHVILKTVRPAELYKNTPTEHAQTPEETLPIGQTIDFDPCGLTTGKKAYISVSLPSDDPEKTAPVNGYIAVDSLTFGTAKEWDDNKKQAAAERDRLLQRRLAERRRAEKQMQNKLEASLGLGPVPDAAKDCISKACVGHLISFRTKAPTVIINGELANSVNASVTDLPAGTQLCTSDTSKVVDGFVRIEDCGINETTKLPNGESKNYLGWVAVNTLTFDIKHPKRYVAE